MPLKKTRDIQIRDPFVVPVQEERRYYLFGSTDRDIWDGPGVGFDCYRSSDLEQWEGPFEAFRPPKGFWGTKNFWAPEVHRYQGSYTMFATFKAEAEFRGTQVLRADAPQGPYAPVAARPATPLNWECLDGTLYVDGDGAPWMVFCHEWVQVHDGGMWAIRLSPDLGESVGRPVFLFNASEARWSKGSGGWLPGDTTARPFPCYVTDGPFLHTTRGGDLLMLWSTHGRQGYAMGTARSTSGLITGPWVQEEEPLWGEDGGHGMVFETFEGQLMLSLHTPNRTPDERALFVPIREEGGRLVIKCRSGIL